MDKMPKRESEATRQAGVMILDKVLNLLSLLNFLSAFAFSVKFMFVEPTLLGIYYGIVSFICAFGFAMLANLK